MTNEENIVLVDAVNTVIESVKNAIQVAQQKPAEENTPSNIKNCIINAVQVAVANAQEEQKNEVANLVQEIVKNEVANAVQNVIKDELANAVQNAAQNAVTNAIKNDMANEVANAVQEAVKEDVANAINAAKEEINQSALDAVQNAVEIVSNDERKSFSEQDRAVRNILSKYDDGSREFTNALGAAEGGDYELLINFLTDAGVESEEVAAVVENVTDLVEGGNSQRRVYSSQRLDSFTRKMLYR